MPSETALRVAVRDAEEAKRRLLDIGAAGSASFDRIYGAARKASTALQETDSVAGKSGRNFQNIGFQVQDFVAQVSGGTSAVTAFAQQAPQAFAALPGPIGVSLGLIATAIGAVLAATGGLGGEQEKLQARLALSGNAAGVTADRMRALADELSRGSSVTASGVAAAQAQLLQFDAVTGDVFEQATAQAARLAQTLGVSVPEAASALGAALDDPANATAELNELGVRLDSTQREQIRSALELGDVMGAQKVVLDEVAEALARGGERSESLVGSFQELGTATGELIGAFSQFLGLDFAEGLRRTLANTRAEIEAVTGLFRQLSAAAIVTPEERLARARSDLAAARAAAQEATIEPGSVLQGATLPQAGGDAAAEAVRLAERELEIAQRLVDSRRAAADARSGENAVAQQGLLIDREIEQSRVRQEQLERTGARGADEAGRVAEIRRVEQERLRLVDASIERNRLRGASEEQLAVLARERAEVVRQAEQQIEAVQRPAQQREANRADREAQRVAEYRQSVEQELASLERQTQGRAGLTTESQHALDVEKAQNEVRRLGIDLNTEAGRADVDRAARVAELTRTLQANAQAERSIQDLREREALAGDAGAAGRTPTGAPLNREQLLALPAGEAAAALDLARELNQELAKINPAASENLRIEQERQTIAAVLAERHREVADAITAQSVANQQSLQDTTDLLGALEQGIGAYEEQRSLLEARNELAGQGITSESENYDLILQETVARRQANEELDQQLALLEDQKQALTDIFEDAAGAAEDLFGIAFDHIGELIVGDFSGAFDEVSSLSLDLGRSMLSGLVNVLVAPLKQQLSDALNAALGAGGTGISGLFSAINQLASFQTAGAGGLLAAGGLGLGIGGLVGQVGGAALGPNRFNATGSAIGGGLGAVAGSFFGVPLVGAAVGSAAGGLLGGLLGGGDNSPNDRASAAFRLSQGIFYEDRSASDQNRQAVRAVAQQLTQLATLLQDFGTEVEDTVLSIRRGNESGLELNGEEFENIGELLRAALQQLTPNADPQVRQVLERTNATDAAGLQRDLQFLREYQNLTGEITTQFSRDLDQLQAHFRDLSQTARRLGFDTQVINDAYREQSVALRDAARANAQAVLGVGGADVNAQIAQQQLRIDEAARTLIELGQSADFVGRLAAQAAEQFRAGLRLQLEQTLGIVSPLGAQFQQFQLQLQQARPAAIALGISIQQFDQAAREAAQNFRSQAQIAFNSLVGLGNSLNSQLLQLQINLRQAAQLNRDFNLGFTDEDIARLGSDEERRLREAERQRLASERANRIAQREADRASAQATRDAAAAQREADRERARAEREQREQERRQREEDRRRLEFEIRQANGSLSDLGVQIAQIKDRFRDLTERAKELNVSTRGLAEAQRREIEELRESTRRDLQSRLGLVSPLRAELDELEALFRDNARVARELGVSERELAEARRRQRSEILQRAREEVLTFTGGLDPFGQQRADILRQARELRRIAPEVGVDPGEIDRAAQEQIRTIFRSMRDEIKSLTGTLAPFQLEISELRQRFRDAALSAETLGVSLEELEAARVRQERLIRDRARLEGKVALEIVGPIQNQIQELRLRFAEMEVTFRELGFTTEQVTAALDAQLEQIRESGREALRDFLGRRELDRAIYQVEQRFRELLPIARDLGRSEAELAAARDRQIQQLRDRALRDVRLGTGQTGPLTRELDELEDRFDALRETARSLGLSTALLDEEQKRLYHDTVGDARDQIGILTGAIGPLQQELIRIREEFEAAAPLARELGIGEDQLNAARDRLQARARDQARLQLQQLEGSAGPLALEVFQLRDSFEEAAVTARLLGRDTARLSEELARRERELITERIEAAEEARAQAADQIRAYFRGVIDPLRQALIAGSGGLATIDAQRRDTLGEFRTTLGQARRDDPEAIQRLAGLGSSAFELIERQFGSGAEAAQQRLEVQRGLREILRAQEARRDQVERSIPEAVTQSGDRIVAALERELAKVTSELAGLRRDQRFVARVPGPRL